MAGRKMRNPFSTESKAKQKLSHRQKNKSWLKQKQSATGIARRELGQSITSSPRIERKWQEKRCIRCKKRKK